MSRNTLYRATGLAAVLAFAPAAIVLPAAAQVSAAEDIIDRANTLNKDWVDLRIEVEDLDGKIPGNFPCPPGTPERGPFLDEANVMSTDQTQLLRQAQVLKQQHSAILLTRTTTGYDAFNHFESEGFSASDINQIIRGIQSVGTQISQLKRKINQTPQTEAQCDGTDDPVATITFAPRSVEPGKVVTGTISATTASGAAVNIKSVNVSGLNTFATLQNTQTPGGAATITFKIDDVRRQGPFQVSLTVQGAPAGAPASATGTRKTQRFTYKVANAAPKIISMPASPSADPGGDVSLDGDIVIIDTNADGSNAGEVRRGNIKVDGHPAGLNTTPDSAFGRAVSITNMRHDPTTGQYTATMKRSATAKSPHPHGVFETSVTVSDKDGKTAQEPLSFTVNNVSPQARFTAPLPPNNAFHSGDGESVAVTGTVTDANGREDITKIEIDASAAGGGTYRMFDGVKTLDVTPTGPDSVRFKIEPETFLHTDNSGRHQIKGIAGDNGAPEQGVAAMGTPFAAFITVGNTAPEVGAIGFLTGTQVVTTKRICPGDFFTSAAQVKDAEGDTLKVTATILPGGQQQVLTLSPGGSTYVGDIQAPATPGEYTIRFEAVETNTNDPKTHLRSMQLTVETCGDPVEEPRIALGGDVNEADSGGVAMGNDPIDTAPQRGIAFTGGYGEFTADGIGEISAGTLVPSGGGGGERALISVELKDWDGWQVGGAIAGPTFRGKPTRFWVDFGEYTSDTDTFGMDPENGEFGVALTFASEFAFDDAGTPATSTGLFLGDSFGLDASARGEGELAYLKFGVDKLKFSGDRSDVHGGVFGFHRSIETDLSSNASASFGGAPFGNITQTNQIRTEIEQFGVGLSGSGRFELFPRDGFRPGLNLNIGGLFEVMNSEANGAFNQTTTCAPEVCGAPLANVMLFEDFDDSGIEIGGAVRFGLDLDLHDMLSVGAGYRYGIVPGIATFDQPVSPDGQPGSWSTDSANYQGFDLSLKLRAAF